MKISKTSILIKFLKFRFYRKFKSNSISLIKKRKWKKTILSSPYYKNIILKNKEFPIMNKALFMENFNLINTVQIKKSEGIINKFFPCLHEVEKTSPQPLKQGY